MLNIRNISPNQRRFATCPFVADVASSCVIRWKVWKGSEEKMSRSPMRRQQGRAGREKQGSLTTERAHALFTRSQPAFQPGSTNPTMQTRAPPSQSTLPALAQSPPPRLGTRPGALRCVLLPRPSANYSAAARRRPRAVWPLAAQPDRGLPPRGT